MNELFAAGLFSTSAPSDAVAGDWRLARWSPRVLRVDADADGDALPVVVGHVARALGLSDESRMSLDTLRARLADVPRSTVLVWVAGTAFADARPQVWEAISQVLIERTRTTPPFAVVLSGAGARRR